MQLFSFESPFMVALIITLSFSSIASLIIRIISYNQEKKKSKIQLDMLRSSLEEKIYKYNDRMLIDEKKWKDVNHLLVEAINNQAKKIVSENVAKRKYNFNFLDSMGINLVDLKVDKNKVFILMPFHDRFYPTYKIISNVCNELRVNCVRADDVFSPGFILKQIIQEMLTSNIIIADIEGRNPNVYYELGLAHAFNKDVIILCKTMDKAPFDIKNQRMIIWNSEKELKNMLNQYLYQILYQE